MLLKTINPHHNAHIKQSEDGEGFLVLVHDKAHDGTGGSVRWEIEAKADKEVQCL